MGQFCARSVLKVKGRKILRQKAADLLGSIVLPLDEILRGTLSFSLLQDLLYCVNGGVTASVVESGVTA